MDGLWQGRQCGLGYSKGECRKMIEMVYKGKDGTEKDEKKLPKNVRQIGEAGRGKRIYLEDYAVTYLHQTEAAVLLGEAWEKDGIRYIFVHGAVSVEDPEFGADIWETVYRDVREYFPDSEVLGWSMQSSEQPEESDQKISRIFKMHFDREDTVLLIYDPAEKEDILFAEENGVLKKAGGYYVYYDKNKSMQEYMVCKNAGKSVEKEENVTDKAIRSFRKMSEEKKDRQGKKEAKETAKETTKQPRNIRFLYAASTFLVLTILIIGVTMINNYDKMKDMEMALSSMAQSTELSAAVNARIEETADSRKEAPAEETARETGREEETETETAVPDTEAAAEVSPQDEVQSASAQEDLGQAAQGKETLAKEKNDVTLSDADNSAQTSDEGKAADAKAAASAEVRPHQAFYTVKNGDTLMDICRMYYGTDEKLDDLCAFNDITDPNSIVPGQKIKLP